MSARVLVVLSLLLATACQSTPAAAPNSQIAINQRGLRERMLVTHGDSARASQEPPGDPIGVEAPAVERAPHGPESAEPAESAEPVESAESAELMMSQPEEPELEASGRRVAFQKIDSEPHRASAKAAAPDPNLAFARDERTQTFDSRERARLRRLPSR